MNFEKDGGQRKKRFSRLQIPLALDCKRAQGGSASKGE
jgi:hypothetical protein